MAVKSAREVHANSSYLTWLVDFFFLYWLLTRRARKSKRAKARRTTGNHIGIAGRLQTFSWRDGNDAEWNVSDRSPFFSPPIDSTILDIRVRVTHFQLFGVIKRSHVTSLTNGVLIWQ
jgi:hypothetical protein